MLPCCFCQARLKVKLHARPKRIDAEQLHDLLEARGVVTHALLIREGEPHRAVELVSRLQGICCVARAVGRGDAIGDLGRVDDEAGLVVPGVCDVADI